MGVELLTFLALAMLAEGALLALFPGALRRMMAEVARLAPERLRRLGLVSLALGAGFLFALAHLAAGGEAQGALGFGLLRAALAGLP